MILTLKPDPGNPDAYEISTPSVGTGQLGDNEAPPPAPTGKVTPPPCGCGDEGQSGDAAPAGNPSGESKDPGYSTDPVRYFDGTPVITGTDLVSTAFGAAWGVSRSFNTPLAVTAGAAPGPYGKGWVVEERPYLIDNGGGTIVAVDSAGTQRWFDWNGSAYTARYFVQDKLTTAAGEFVLTGTDGSVTRYYNFDTSLPAAQRGAFKSRTDPAGNVTSMHSLDGSGRPPTSAAAAAGSPSRC